MPVCAHFSLFSTGNVLQQLYGFWIGVSSSGYSTDASMNWEPVPNLTWNGEWWLRDAVHEKGRCGSRDESQRDICRVAQVSPFLGKPARPPSRNMQSEFVSPIQLAFSLSVNKEHAGPLLCLYWTPQENILFFSAGSCRLKQKSFQKSFISLESVGVLVPVAVSSHSSLLLGDINAHSSSTDCSTAHNKIDSLLIFFLLSFNCSSSWYHLKWTLALRNQCVPLMR